MSMHTNRTAPERGKALYRFISQQMATIHSRLEPGALVTVVVRRPGGGKDNEIAITNGDDFKAVAECLLRLKERYPEPVFSHTAKQTALRPPPSARRARAAGSSPAPEPESQE